MINANSDGDNGDCDNGDGGGGCDDGDDGSVITAYEIVL
jgi:hypothetical protein